MKDGLNFVGEDTETYARAARFAIDAAPFTLKTVAWIGGGMCVGPRLFTVTRCTQTVYEIEPSFAEFCPVGITFVPGDWRVTLTGRFDIIVFDLGGPVPYGDLTPFLNIGGIILPEEGQP